MQTIREIRTAEDALNRSFCSVRSVSPNVTELTDAALPDMRDLNFFQYRDTVSKEEIAEAIDRRIKGGGDFVKFQGSVPIGEKLPDGWAFDAYTDLTMYLSNVDPKGWKRNPSVLVKTLKEEDIFSDLLSLELSMYGKIYGEDFATRKMRHWLSNAETNPHLNFYAAYLGGKIAGSLYTYRRGEFVGIDGLAVHPDFRMQYVATTLLAEAILREGGTAFLHADSDDTPKDLYQKLGFRTVDTRYHYLCLFPEAKASEP